MPVYPYRCKVCGCEGDLVKSVNDIRVPDCPDCRAAGLDSIPMTRVYTPFAFSPSMPAHFNRSTGTYVRNARDFADQLKRRSEQENMRHRAMAEMSVEMGVGETTNVDYEVNLQPVDPADQRDVFGITDEGMDETRRRHRELGITERRTLFL